MSRDSQPQFLLIATVLSASFALSVQFGASRSACAEQQNDVACRTLAAQICKLHSRLRMLAASGISVRLRAVTDPQALVASGMRGAGPVDLLPIPSSLAINVRGPLGEPDFLVSFGCGGSTCDHTIVIRDSTMQLTLRFSGATGFVSQEEEAL
jgi:hypothetical protein